MQSDPPPPIPSPSKDPVAFRELWEKCPLYEPDDKLAEALYFLGQMGAKYHEPDPFRWNLNAFLQTLRSVTFLLQRQLSDRPSFRDWYEKQQEIMRSDPLLRKFVEGRNVVVKQRNLYFKSSVKMGYFRYRKPKQWMEMNISPHTPSVLLLERLPNLGLVHPEHAWIGEEYGVSREWIVEELGDSNVLDLCYQAWRKLHDVIEAAHNFLGIETPDDVEIPVVRSSDHNVLTESDADPSLPEKWGWG